MRTTMRPRAEQQHIEAAPWGGIVLALVWAFLAGAAILALAAVAGAQTLDEAPLPLDDCTADLGPEVDIGLGPVVALEDVEWAGLLWGTEDGYRPAHLVSAEVEIQVTGLVARARVTQRFANPGDTWMEGLYLFPLPDEAAVDQLRMVVGDRILEGQVKEKAEARQVYETAKAEGRKATLVERHRPNVFSTRVANVGPGEAVEVVLEMQQPVRWDQGEMALRFPTVVNPRYFPGETPAAPELAIEPPLLA